MHNILEHYAHKAVAPSSSPTSPVAIKLRKQNTSTLLAFTLTVSPDSIQFFAEHAAANNKVDLDIFSH